MGGPPVWIHTVTQLGESGDKTSAIKSPVRSKPLRNSPAHEHARFGRCGQSATPMSMLQTTGGACYRCCSGRPAAFNSARSMRCRAPNTSASCPWPSRRRKVHPEPKPSSMGICCHVIPVYSTNRTLCGQRRSSTGRGPGGRSGQADRRGSTKARNPSSTIHGLLLTPSRTDESSRARSAPFAERARPDHAAPWRGQLLTRRGSGGDTGRTEG